MRINELLEARESNSVDRDELLAELCSMIIQGQRQNPDYYGMVAAAVVDPENNIVRAVNHFDDSTDRRVHAERAAIDAYKQKYGELPPGCAVVTTLSPCSEDMDERYGESCQQLLDDLGITDVYCGYQDPTQDSGYTVTTNKKIQQLCQAFADTFLDDCQLNELMFMGMSPCTKDCSGHRAGYEWSARHNNANSASWSDSFNRGAAIKAAGY